MVGGVLAAAGAGVVASVLVLLLRQYRPELSLLLSLAAAALVFLLVLNELRPLITSVKEIAAKTAYSGELSSTLLRCLGIGCITEFGADLCRDAGQSAVAFQVEFAGKVLTVAAAFPLFLSVLETALELIVS